MYLNSLEEDQKSEEWISKTKHVQRWMVSSANHVTESDRNTKILIPGFGPVQLDVSAAATGSGDLIADTRSEFWLSVRMALTAPPHARKGLSFPCKSIKILIDR